MGMQFEAIGKQLQGNWETNSKSIGERLESNAIANLGECYLSAFGKQLECGWKAFEIQFECNWTVIGMLLECNWNEIGMKL